LNRKSNIRGAIRKIALLNAMQHKGKAQSGSVIGKLLADFPRLKSDVKEIMPLVKEVVEEVNGLGYKVQKQTVERLHPKALTQKKPTEAKKKLPPLPNLSKYKTIRTRFSPNPDAPIHLGSARAIFLCHEYATMYNGEFFVRFEDTDPKVKTPQLEFYDFIKQDLRWLKCDPDAYFVQSDRLEIYYKNAEQLIKDGNAYVCTCIPEKFREYISSKKSCPCRSLLIKAHVERWQRMLDGTYKEGDAVVRVKTDLSHPNPAVRDWPALRIIDTEVSPHPRVGSKYRVWPLYNLACGIDDHLMGITHIIRGKEHLTNQARQEFMYKYFGWQYPEAIHYGRLKITGASLSKSKIVQGMRDGLYKSWDDPRLATFAALRRRGIQAEAIKNLIIDIGPKTQDVTISWENLYAYNRKIVEPIAKRYFFIEEPRRMTVSNLPRRFKAEIPLHPSCPEMGLRNFNIEPKGGVVELWITSKDVDRMKERTYVRLMELFNVRVKQVKDKTVYAQFQSERYEDAKKAKAPLIHWLPKAVTIKCEVILPNNQCVNGLAERSCSDLRVNDLIQFQRFGFVRIDEVKDNFVRAIFTHR
jgi:glutamyl-tRNA synthetase